MKKKQVAIIGLGTFGYNVAVELVKKDIQVLAIDNDSETVNRINRFVTQALEWLMQPMKRLWKMPVLQIVTVL